MTSSTTLHEVYPPHRELHLRLDTYYQLWLNDEPVQTFWRNGRDIILTIIGSPMWFTVPVDEFLQFTGDRPVKVGSPLLY